MHPKAAYLALHGLRPMLYGKNIRVRRHIKGMEEQLVFSWLGEWVISGSLGLDAYETIDWEDITDAQYDALPQEMIDEFLETY